MAQIIIHNNLSVEEVNEKRLFENFNLSHKQRMINAFKLMRLSILFSKNNVTEFKKQIIIKNK